MTLQESTDSLKGLAFPNVILNCICDNENILYKFIFLSLAYKMDHLQQGKSEGFESCDPPMVRKCPIWVKIGDVLSSVTFFLTDDLEKQ